MESQEWSSPDQYSKQTGLPIGHKTPKPTELPKLQLDGISVEEVILKTTSELHRDTIRYLFLLTNTDYDKAFLRGAKSRSLRNPDGQVIVLILERPDEDDPLFHDRRGKSYKYVARTFNPHTCALIGCAPRNDIDHELRILRNQQQVPLVGEILHL
jgi:hypothetical protein